MKKLSKLFFLTLSSSMAIVLPSAFALNSSSQSINNDGNVSDMSSSKQRSVATRSDYTNYPGTSTTPKNVHLVDLSQTGIIQHTAYDLNGSGYATFTSSTSQSRTSPKTVNQISKFLTKNVYDNTGKVIKEAGSLDWSISDSDLLSLINNNPPNNGNTLKFKAILFSVGGQDSFKSLFVLADLLSSGNSNQGSYLFQIQWEDQTIGEVTQKAGNYRLACKLSNNSTNNQYNFLSLETPSTHTLQALNVKDISNNNQQNVSDFIKYVSVSNSNFNNNALIENEKSISLNLSNNNIKNEFDLSSSQTYKPIYVNRINSNIFVLMQKENGSNPSTKEFVVLKSPSIAQNTGSVLEITDVKNLDISTSTSFVSGATTSSTKSDISILYNDNNNAPAFDFLISKDNSNSYQKVKLDFSNFTLTENKTFTGYHLNKGIKQLVKVYKNNSTSIDGYLALTKDNKVIQLNDKFESTTNSLLFDFKKSTINFGDINFIYTQFGDSNWYAQGIDGKIYVFSKDTFVGVWEDLSSKETYEIPVRFNIKSKKEVPADVLYKNVLLNENTYDTAFLQFLNSPESYKNFLTVDESSIDPRLNGQKPIIEVKIQSKNGTNGTPDSNPTPSINEEEKKSKKYKITFDFYQILRVIKPNGEVLPSTDPKAKKVKLGSQSYTFINANAVVNSKAEGNNATFPEFIKKMYPSQIIEILKQAQTSDSQENKNFLDYFVQVENVSAPTFSFFGSDLDGTLSIRVVSKYAWQNGVLGPLNTTFNFGTEAEPFFAYNPFGKTSNGKFNDSITPVDKTFENSSIEEERRIYERLKTIYSSKLPSTVTKQEIYDDFLVLGSAFGVQQYIDNGTIILPELETDMKIIPDDKNGKMFVEVVFPQIGPKLNYKVKFETAPVFAKDISASQTVYFSWQNTNEIKLTPGSSYTGGSSIASIKASDVANMINAASQSISTNGPQSLLEILTKFANFSDFYANMIATEQIIVNATFSDKYGVLNIMLKMKNGEVIPGMDSSVITMTYSGFKIESNAQSGDISLVSNFQFGTYNGPKDKTPSSITETDLATNGLLPDNWSTLKSNNSVSLQLTPSNATGVLSVTVTVTNYFDNTNDQVYPSKTLSTLITGLKTSEQPNNLIAWKSNYDLYKDLYNDDLTEKTPSQIKSKVLTKANDDAGSQLNPSYKYYLLKNLAYISNELDKRLQENPKAVSDVSIIEDDVYGTLTVAATIKFETGTENFSSVINGFKGTNYTFSLDFVVSDDDQSNPNLLSLRSKKASEVSSEDKELQSLYKMKTSDNLTRNITLTPDDNKGTLIVNIKIDDPKTGDTLVQESRTYSGFVKTIYTDKGTNWGIVIMSIIIPIIVFSIPLFLMGYINNRKDMKKIAGRLSKRLSDEQDRARRRQKLFNIDRK